MCICMSKESEEKCMYMCWVYIRAAKYDISIGIASDS